MTRSTSPAQRAGRSRVFEWISALLGSCVLLFILAPLVKIFLSTPVADLARTALDGEVLQSIKMTLTAAGIATMFSALAGIPLAWLLARRRFPGRPLLLAIIDLPVIIPHSAAGIALLTVIGRHSFLGEVLGHGLTGTVAGIAVAMAFVSMPFLMNAAREAFAAVPERLEKAALTLGASSSRVFFTISLPMAWRGILSGLIMMWARGISEFGSIVIIAYYPMTTPVMIFQRFNDFGLHYARSVAVLLILVCIIIFIALRLITQSRMTEVEHA